MPSIGILGPSGQGKSSGIRPPVSANNPVPLGLDPASTFIIAPDMKGLPFRGWKSLFPQNYDSDGKIDLKTSRLYMQDQTKNTKGDLVTRLATNGQVVLGLMQALEKDQSIKNGVIDTLTHIFINSFIMRAQETGYQKFTDLAEIGYKILNHARFSRINWFILMHSEDAYDVSGNRITKVRTVGKLLDEKIEIPSLFTIMLAPAVEKDPVKGDMQYWLRTKTLGNDVVKAPHGMFDEKIPNDYGLVLTLMEEYENSPA